MPPRSHNAVRGPASALTSFLRDQGITARHGTGYQARARQNESATLAAEQGGAAANAEAGPGPSSSSAAAASNSGRQQLTSDQREALRELEQLDNGDEDEGIAPRPKKHKTMQVESDSEDIDRDDNASTSAVQRKRKAFEELSLQKRKEAAAAAARLEYDDDDSDSDGLDDRPRKKAAKKAVGPPVVGARMDCGDCGKTFSYSKYSPPAPGASDSFLCHACTKVHYPNGYKGPSKAAPKKVERRQVVHYEAKERVPLLTDICISIVAKHVEDVDALGDIGPVNLKKVNNIICKNRQMTTQTANLFWDASVTDLTMKDCTKIDTDGFVTLAALCPHLESLHLSLCGQMLSSSLSAFGKLQKLARLELYAPFLVRAEAWVEFFEAMGARERGGLDGFLVRMSPRLDKKGLDALVKGSPGLKELRLSQVALFTESWLTTIAQLKYLTLLDISYPVQSLDGSTPVAGAPAAGGSRGLNEAGLMSTATDPVPDAAPSSSTASARPFVAAKEALQANSQHAFVDLLAAVGRGLTHLSLGGQSFLTPELLARSVGANCPNLVSVDLSDLPLLTDDETAAFVTAWAPKTLAHARFKACHRLGAKTLGALLALEGELETLDIAGWKDCEEEALKSIGVLKGRSLRKLDIGWCRNVTDFTLKDIVDHSPLLEHVHVWGCNQLTRNHPRRKGLKVTGVESHEFGSSALA